MSLNHRQLRRLHRIESGLLRSDPQLTAMLVMFARLAAGQDMPVWEQEAPRPDCIRQAAALIVKAVTVLAATIALLLNVVRAVVLGGPVRRPADGAPATRPGRDGQGRNPVQGS
jgi:hypothetical protein